MRLLSISICLICTLATFADAQVEGGINPCATKSYFYKEKGQWHLYVYELGKTKVLGTGKTGPHYEFGPPMKVFTVPTTALDDYDKFVDEQILPFRYFAQLAGYCPITDELGPINKLVLEISSLNDEHSICDSKLVVARYKDDWRLTCRGCSRVRLKDVMGADKAKRLKDLAWFASYEHDDADTLSFDMLLPNKCGEEK